MKRIIIAEDELFLARMLKLALLRAGYLAERIDDGERAWKVLEGNNVDALIASVDLPGVDGLELAKRLRERGHTQPVVLLRSSPDERLLSEAQALDRVLVVDKPASIRSLIGHLEETFGEDTNADTFVGEPQAS